MSKVTHPDFVEKLKSMYITELLFAVVEAKAGRHIDIIDKVPLPIITEAENALNKLIAYSKTIEA